MGYMSLHDFTRRLRDVVRVQRVRRRCSKEGVGGMHRGGRIKTLTAATMLVAVVLSACTDSPEPTPSPTPTATETTATPSSSPTPSPSPPSESELAATNAEALVREYYQLIDHLGTARSAPLTALEDVAISKDLDSWRRQFERARRDGWTQTGETKLVELDVQSVNLDNSDPAAGRVPVVQVDVCFDVTDVEVRNASGVSVVIADRPPTGWIRHTISNYSWENNPSDGWRVSTSVDLERTPCDPAAS